MTFRSRLRALALVVGALLAFAAPAHAQSAGRFQSPNQQFLNASGVPYAGGLLFFYASGTTTPQSTFSDAALTVPNTNPVILDSAGQAGSVFLQSTPYKVILEDSTGNIIWSEDPVSAGSIIFAGTTTGSGGAYLLSYSNAAFSYVNGEIIAFHANFTSVGSDTLNVNSLGAKNLYKPASSGPALLAAGDIQSGFDILVQYDSTLNSSAGGFAVIGGLTQSVGCPGPGSATAGDVPTFTGTGCTIQDSGKTIAQLTPFGIQNTASGLKIVNDNSTPNTKIDITANSVMLANGTGGYFVPTSISPVIDLTCGAMTSTVNCMDGEARPTSGWVYLYVIYNGTVTGAVASTSASAPTLPTGYTYLARVGAMRLDGSQNLLRTRQLGRHGQYVVTGSTNTAALPSMANGAAGSVSSPTWVSVSTTAFVPSTASSIEIIVTNDWEGNSVANVIAAPNNQYGAVGDDGGNIPPIYIPGGAGSNSEIAVAATFLLESTNIYWAASAGGGAISCLGWDDGP